jgi:hypothetical protein
MFQGVERQCELMFCILGIEKSDIDEVGYVMFPIGEWPSKIIFCLLAV